MNVSVKYGMSFGEYQAAPGLSQSAMKKLAMSPLDYWIHSAHNPNRPKDEEKDYLDYGHAAHARILEGADAFNSRFCPKINRADYPEFLASGDELAARCEELGLAKSGTIRQRSERIRKADPGAMLWVDIEESHANRAGNRQQISQTAMQQIEFAASMLEANEHTRNLLTGGKPEVSIFWTDDDTGVELKARLDYLNAPSIVDLKTFSNPKGLSVEDAIAKAVADKNYGLQAVMYCDAYKAAAKAGLLDVLHDSEPKFTFIFLQSGPVANVRVRHLVPRPFGEESAFWGRCEREYRHYLGMYAMFKRSHGFDRPWVDPVVCLDFIDEDFPSYAL